MNRLHSPGARFWRVTHLDDGLYRWWWSRTLRGWSKVFERMDASDRTTYAWQISQVNERRRKASYRRHARAMSVLKAAEQLKAAEYSYGGYGSSAAWRNLMLTMAIK